jgi:RNA-dependent RNA polymerase
MADPDCVRLAALHSDAVDFPKTGRHVSFSQLPKPKSKRKPDWYANETNERKSEFYQSTRHIGHLFRDISLPAIPEAQRAARRQNRRLEAGTEDVTFRAVRNAYSRNTGLISQLVRRKLDDYVDISYHESGDVSGEIEEMLDIFERYSRELGYTCSTHSLSKWTALTEEEVVAGTIVAKCSQPVGVLCPLNIYSNNIYRECAQTRYPL